jgi:glycerate 2-kinase
MESERMKIIIAPDSFKESLSAPEVAKCIEQGFREIFPDASYVVLPIADGGEGTVNAMIAATAGNLRQIQVSGPLGRPVDGFYGVSSDGKTVFIEMAAASGLDLVKPEERNPLLTYSRGTGELILAALTEGVEEMIVGIGGSATNDGGAGMLQAIGVRLLDRNGQDIAPGGQGLGMLETIDYSAIDSRLAACRIQVACDVHNPLTGPRGASAVFGPQKGATPEMVAELDANLAHFGKLLEKHTGRMIVDKPGAGAAGGMGAALMTLSGATLRPGIEIVIEAVRLEEAVVDADLVITGEGRLDGQTSGGKAPAGVAKVAVKYGVPVIGIGGSLGSDLKMDAMVDFSAMFAAVSKPCSLAEALSGAKENLQLISRNVAAAIRTGVHML